MPIRKRFLLLLLLAASTATADSPRDMFDAGSAALENNDCAKAVEYFEQAQNEYSSDPAFILSLAKAYRCSGALDHALTWYRKYDALSPDVPEIRKAIGEVIYQQGVVEEKKRRDMELEAERKKLREKQVAICERGCRTEERSCKKRVAACVDRVDTDWDTDRFLRALERCGDMSDCGSASWTCSRECSRLP